MKVTEQYFSSMQDAEAEKTHFEAMEGLEPVNFYRLEKIETERE